MTSSRFPFQSVLPVTLIVLVVGMFVFAEWAAEYLWFEALGYTPVFWTLRLVKVALFLAVSTVIFFYFGINFRVLAMCPQVRVLGHLSTPSGSGSGWYLSSHPGMRYVWLLVAAVIALGFSLVLIGRWDTILRFFWSQPVGTVDPIFGRDIGFYLFSLPFYELVQNTLTVATLLGLIIIFLVYSMADVLHMSWERGFEATPVARWHLTSNLAMYFLLLAWGFYLDRFALLHSAGGAVYGAGFTDVYVVRHAIAISAVATLGVGVALLVPALLMSGLRMMVVTVAYLSLLVVGLGIVPWAVQRLHVEPNELELEKPFLRYNIAFTRAAFGLDSVEERSYDALSELSLENLARNRQTIDNIRLWDWRPLRQAFRQLQQIRTYYHFDDVDVDRYWVDNAYRQVLLSARELSETLPQKAETWINRRLQYTHGYGLAMTFAADKGPEGSPVLIIKDLPPLARGGLKVSRPEIYYGEHMSGHRIVNTLVKEFDYPQGDKNVYTHYAGRGGIPLDTAWKRALFAWDQSDVRILLTSYISPASRIQLRREVAKRTEHIAPFLRLDRDPYLALSATGHLYWILDAYTESMRYPYSEPYQGRFNYIRNPVKVAVDAYNGEVTFHVIDPYDPVLAVYRAAMPALFRPIEAMPEGLREHLRYPQDLFAVQLDKFNTYHMTVPQVFYNGEDIWSMPWEKFGGEQIRMKPYYIMMRLPREQTLQFLLMSPLTPKNRGNMIAWMAARCDYPHYGELIVYKLPKERLILGPIQVEALIDQDTVISQQLSLWDQRGSRVVRGNLLVIPIEQSLIYVEPVFLIAERTDIPQLKRVIVSDGERLAMEPTLADALQQVFGKPQRLAIDMPADGKVGLFAEARNALNAAEKALAKGDWGEFGRAMQRLQGLLAK